MVQDPSQNNVDNLNTVRHENRRKFRNVKKEYTKVEIEEIETNSKMKNIRDLYRGINDFKKGYHFGLIYVVKKEKNNLISDSHCTLSRWRNHYSQLFNVHGVSGFG